MANGDGEENTASRKSSGSTYGDYVTYLGMLQLKRFNPLIAADKIRGAKIMA